MPRSQDLNDQISQRLRQRSICLLKSRGLDALARCELTPEERSHWGRLALAIESAIYSADEHFEDNQQLDTMLINRIAGSIEHTLCPVVTPTQRAWYEWHQLLRYKEVEERLHLMQAIDCDEFEGILDLKCADVRLARELMWLVCGRQPPDALRRFWRTLDRCHELTEDWCHWPEDRANWNLNLWIHGMRVNPSEGAKGLRAASALLRHDLKSLERLGTAVEERRRRVSDPALVRVIRRGKAVLQEVDRLNPVALAQRTTRYEVVPVRCSSRDVA